MKKWTMIFASLVLLVMSASVPKSYAGDKLTSASFDSVKIYYGKGKMSIHNTGGLYVTVLTPNEAAYGVYNDAIRKNEQASVISWTGSGPAPVLILTDYGNADSSNCPGINTATFQCAYETFKITVQSDSYGCPWLASFYTITDQPGFGRYTGPTNHATVCPTIPVASYDISWSENYVSHNKALQLQSNGSTITTTLSTYLMEDGKLCDGSVFDSRGAYCRVVSELLTFTSYGCDKSTVTLSPTRHPVTDKQLHDIVVNVNTSSRQPIDSTCRFQYVLNEL
ncbi:YfcO family protein [Escherichia coli]|uniref:StfH/YfcO family fimbrial adhesin n=1 Tax=Escherichia coli TaxID=562 RepID=UPI0020C9F5E9|nr:StfH/YfcO family fimbrial adhesin [Escherichia coli]UTP14633.1 YfcO family protein [Escherichia coli]